MDPVIQSVSSEPKLTKLHFSWIIRSFKQIALGAWHEPLESKELDVFPNCCSFKFNLRNEKRTEIVDGEDVEKVCFTIGSVITKGPPDIENHLRTHHKFWNQTWEKYLVGKDQQERICVQEGAGFSYSFVVPEKGLGKNDTIKLSYVTDGSLEVRINLSLVSLEQNSETVLQELQPAEDLAVNLGNLLEIGSHSDFVIRLKDHESIKVHKAILAARSPVFNSMLSADMRESKENLVNLEFLDPQVVEKFVRYIYTDELESPEEVGDQGMFYMELLKLADQYQMYRLKTLCELELTKSHSAENIVEVLKLADTYQAEDLLASALEFLKIDKSALATRGALLELLSHSTRLEECVLGSISLKPTDAPAKP